VKKPKYQYEHPTQLAASTFLLAAAEGDAVTMWAAISRETRGLLEGLYAARSGVSLRVAAGVERNGMDERLGAVLAPLRASVFVALGEDRLGGYGVLADFHPVRNNFRLSVGLLRNRNKVCSATPFLPLQERQPIEGESLSRLPVIVILRPLYKVLTKSLMVVAMASRNFP